MSKKTVIRIVIVIWFIVASCYFLRTPWNVRSHDTFTHVEYTEFIVKNHRLPQQKEIWRGGQLPLYYVINSFILGDSLKAGGDKKLEHVNSVRFISIVYGGIALFLIFLFVKEITQNNLFLMLVLLFICTTPKYVYVFSTYNDDSLATLLCIAIAVISYQLYLKWSTKLALLLLVITTVAFYTKYTVFLCISALIISLCFLHFLKVKHSPNLFKIIIIYLFSAILLLTGVFTPTFNVLQRTSHSPYLTKATTPQLRTLKNILGNVLRMSNLQDKHPDYTNEWDDPFAHPDWYKTPPKTTKRYDYFAYQFVTSVIGEYTYQTLRVEFIQSTLWIHLFFYLIALWQSFKSVITKFGILTITSAFVAEVIFLMPTFIFFPQPSPDYRYICWTWIGWATLYSAVDNKGGAFHKFIVSLLLVAVFLHVYILVTVTGGTVEV